MPDGISKYRLNSVMQFPRATLCQICDESGVVLSRFIMDTGTSTKADIKVGEKETFGVINHRYFH